MIFEKIYVIDKWIDWNNSLNESIKDFFEKYSYYPNILEANAHTYSQFDFLINVTPDEKENLRRYNKQTNRIEKPIYNEYVGISSFENLRTSVDFAIDINLKDKEYRLIYDSDPDWEETNEIINSPVEEFEKIKNKG